MNSDKMGEFRTAAHQGGLEDLQEETQKQTGGHVIPRHVSSPVATNSHTPTTGSLPPSIVNSKPATVRVGFFPASTPPVETTDPVELPGSMDPVITKPPHSGSKFSGRVRASSIEEMDRQRMNYTPTDTKRVLLYGSGGGGEEATAFCLDIGSFMSGQYTDDRQSLDSGRGDSVHRKASIPVSEVSTISVSGLQKSG